MKRLGRYLSPSVVLLLVWGCATGGQERQEVRDVQVEVVNDLTPRSAITVRIAGVDTGMRAILGSVSPGSTRGFWFGLSGGQGSYQLIAEATDGREIASRAFQVGIGDRVEWSVRRNSVELGRQPPPGD